MVRLVLWLPFILASFGFFLVLCLVDVATRSPRPIVERLSLHTDEGRENFMDAIDEKKG